MESDKKISAQQGHWVLANAGKKILRPGGLELTRIMLKNLDINSSDDVVEFAPGLGITAAITCGKNPKSYTGVDRSSEAADIVKKRLNYQNARVVVADAANTTLPNEFATKMYGEAMLSMHIKKRKLEIINEAARILKKGGLYGIHELGLYPDNVGDEVKQQIFKEMATAIQAPVQPLTIAEWTELLESAGFRVISCSHNPMHLLNRRRMIQDEGFFRFLKIMWNVMCNKEVRKRVHAMKGVFTRHKDHLNAITIVAQKL